MKVHLEDVSFVYDKEPALEGICLSIPEGSLTVVCGVTGSGKSTLMRLISGLEKPSSGSITYTEQNVELSVSMVFQQPEAQLFAGSVYKDVEYGLEQHRVPKAERSALVHSALAQVGLPCKEFGERSPFLLSGGEKRRLCIAGAIAVHPELLILDEPTAGLDPAATRGLMQMLQELKQNGLTIIIATHDLDVFFPVADEIVIMSQGSLHYSGPVQPLNADPGKLIEAGLMPPAYIRIGGMLREHKLLQSIPDNIEDLLEALRTRPLPVQASCLGDSTGGLAIKEAETPYSAADSRMQQPPAGAAHNQSPAASARWQGLDPRVKWLGMLSGSVVILGMNTLIPLLLATGLVAGLLLSSGISLRRTVWFFRPFLIMFLFLWILSSLSWDAPDFGIGPLSFSFDGIRQGGVSVLRFLLLIALGFLFTETTAGAPLREGLEWAFAPLKKLGIRTRNWSLAVSITLQFVPWILGKLSQLQTALNSRGRQKNTLGRWTPRQISMLVVPLVILVIGMGDELATAIESRGYDPAKKRTPSYTLVWRQKDTLAIIYILLAAAILWWCSRTL